MTDKELLEQLRTEVVAETPDCWSAILARVQAPAQQPEEEKIVPMPERGRRRGAWKRWVAAAAVFFLAVLGGGLYATQVPGGVATLDANPSIELTVNKLGRVLSARACNPDAQFVLDDLELRNQSLQTAADEIVAAMQTDGYLSADTNSVLVTVEAGKGDTRLRDRLAAAVESAQTDCGMDPAVLAQVLEVDPELEAYASAAGVSAGKAMLIRQISDQAFGGQHHLSDGCCVLQSGTGDLGRVHDACSDHILDKDLVLGIEAVVGLVGRDDLVDDDAALQTGVLGDLAQRSLQSLQHDLGTGALVALQRIAQGAHSGDGIDGSGTAAGHDAVVIVPTLELDAIPSYGQQVSLELHEDSIHLFDRESEKSLLL